MEKKIGPISALGYLLVLAAGITLVCLGGKDLFLLVIGKPASAKVTSVDSRQTGRRRGGTQTFIEYKYVVDGVTHEGGGKWHGRMQAVAGDKADVRYLPFAPGASSPADGLVGPGLVLTAIGGILIAVEISFFMKRRRREDEPRGAAPPKQRQRRKTA